MTYSKEQARLNLISAIRQIEGALGLAGYDAIKTEGYYQRTLNRAVLDFYRGGDAGALIDTMIRLIEDQFRRAWNEGARKVGYDPEDMTDDDILVLMERIEQEKDYVLDFAGGIEQARINGDPVKPFQDRVSMWANRYNEIVSWAQSYFGGKTRLVWVLGPTEHCDMCLTLSGFVATAEQWNIARAAGIYPQSRSLDCGGYRCQCSLKPTQDKLSDGDIPYV